MLGLQDTNSQRNAREQLRNNYCGPFIGSACESGSTGSSGSINSQVCEGVPSSYIPFIPVVDNAMVTETQELGGRCSFSFSFNVGDVMVTINTRSVEDAVFLLLQCRRCDGDCTRSVEDAVFLLLQCRLCDGDYKYTFGGRCSLPSPSVSAM